MWRWIWNILVGLSLILFVVTVFFWVHSNRGEDALGVAWRYYGPDIDLWRVAIIGSMQGEMMLGVSFERGVPPEGAHWPGRPHPRLSMIREMGSHRRYVSFPSNSRYAFGFGCSGYWNHRSFISFVESVESGAELMVPHWFLAIVFAILPIWRFGGWKCRQRRYRLAHGISARIAATLDR